MDLAKDVDRPFHVRSVPGNSFVAGFGDIDLANASCELRNAAAKTLGIKTTYTVVVKEQSAN